MSSFLAEDRFGRADLDAVHIDLDRVFTRCDAVAIVEQTHVEVVVLVVDLTRSGVDQL